MVSITRTLSLEEYKAANSLLLANGTAKQRRNYLLFVRYGPYIGGVLLVLGVWLGIYSLQTSVRLYSVAVAAVAMAVMLLPQRWGLNRRLKKLYLAQQLDRPWTLSVSEDGVHSMLTGLVESHLLWDYFTGCAENEDLLVLMNTRRLSFVAFPKRELTADELAQLREDLRGRLPFSNKAA